jgi:hypothetical protein
MIEPGTSVEHTEEEAPPGWYPDMTDSGLMRYWDGFHFTGQTTPVEPLADEPGGMPKMSKPGDPPTPMGPASSVAAPGPGRPRVALLAEEFQPRAGEAPSAIQSQAWNGFGQSAPSLAAMTPVQAVQAIQAVQPVAASEPSPEQDTWTALRGVGEVSDQQDDDGSSPFPVAEVAAKDSAKDAAQATAEVRATPVTVVAAGTPADPEAAEGKQPATWAEKLGRAVATAQGSGTPDAWRDVAETAAVMEELAHTMVVAAAATHSSEEAKSSAEQAQREAEVAARRATEADQQAQRAIGVAEQAEAASHAAAKAAADATKAAQQTAEAAPRMAEAAKTAALTAETALRKSRGIEAIVAKALEADTPEAWSEAHELVGKATA